MPEVKFFFSKVTNPRVGVECYFIGISKKSELILIEIHALTPSLPLLVSFTLLPTTQFHLPPYFFLTTGSDLNRCTQRVGVTKKKKENI